MTEQEFQRQTWRMYDQITTADGVKGKVMGVSFTTKSVKAYISGSPEWVRCELIETHTTGRGGDGDDTAIVEELHNKVLRQQIEIATLKSEKMLLTDKISKNYLPDLLKAVNVIKEGLTEKKNKIEKVETGLSQIALIMERFDKDE